MKITIRQGPDCKVITIPNGLLFHPISGWLLQTAGKKYLPDTLKTADTHALRAILAELRRVQKRYGTWTLVEVRSSDGEEVTITI